MSDSNSTKTKTKAPAKADAKNEAQTESATETVVGTQLVDASLLHEVNEKLSTALAMIDSFSDRIDALEAAPQSGAVDDVRDGRARVTHDSAPDTMAGMSQTTMQRWQELQDRRAAAPSRGTLKIDPSRLEQVAREVEAQNITSVQTRLQNLKTAGKLADFRVLPPGSVRPSDSRVDRLLLTVDSNGFIISSEVG